MAGACAAGVDGASGGTSSSIRPLLPIQVFKLPQLADVQVRHGPPTHPACVPMDSVIAVAVKLRAAVPCGRGPREHINNVFTPLVHERRRRAAAHVIYPPAN